MSTLLETVATGAAVGLGLWFFRRTIRRAAGFAAKPAAEGFALEDDVRQKTPGGVCEVLPGVTSLRAYVLKRWGGKDAGICGDPSHQARASDHNVGRAWDWSIPGEREADDFIAWLAANQWERARRLGIGTVIHDGRIWSSWVDGAAPMSRSYKGSNPHKHHVHLSFSKAGARGETSGYAMLERL